mmetsp:Transcript_55900/g.170168  ORF Transcript_55900/g.170168 Transcript_55900/m.170168 type:complete len:119 (+) Transcript_55900:1431-1787(+)
MWFLFHDHDVDNDRHSVNDDDSDGHNDDGNQHDHIVDHHHHHDHDLIHNFCNYHHEFIINDDGLKHFYDDTKYNHVFRAKHDGQCLVFKCKRPLCNLQVFARLVRRIVLPHLRNDRRV